MRGKRREGKGRGGLFQLEETFKDHLVQLHDFFRAIPKLKHITKGIVQTSLEHL